MRKLLTRKNDILTVLVCFLIGTILWLSALYVGLHAPYLSIGVAYLIYPEIHLLTYRTSLKGYEAQTKRAIGLGWLIALLIVNLFIN